MYRSPKSYIIETYTKERKEITVIKKPCDNSCFDIGVEDIMRTENLTLPSQTLCTESKKYWETVKHDSYNQKQEKSDNCSLKKIRWNYPTGNSIIQRNPFDQPIIDGRRKRYTRVRELSNSIGNKLPCCSSNYKSMPDPEQREQELQQRRNIEFDGYRNRIAGSHYKTSVKHLSPVRDKIKDFPNSKVLKQWQDADFRLGTLNQMQSTSKFKNETSSKDVSSKVQHRKMTPDFITACDNEYSAPSEAFSFQREKYFRAKRRARHRHSTHSRNHSSYRHPLRSATGRKAPLWKIEYDNKYFIQSKINHPAGLHKKVKSPKRLWNIEYSNKYYIWSKINKFDLPEVVKLEGTDISHIQDTHQTKVPYMGQHESQKVNLTDLAVVPDQENLENHSRQLRRESRESRQIRSDDNYTYIEEKFPCAYHGEDATEQREANTTQAGHYTDPLEPERSLPSSKDEQKSGEGEEIASVSAKDSDQYNFQQPSPILHRSSGMDVEQDIVEDKKLQPTVSDDFPYETQYDDYPSSEPLVPIAVPDNDDEYEEEGKMKSEFTFVFKSQPATSSLVSDSEVSQKVDKLENHEENETMSEDKANDYTEVNLEGKEAAKSVVTYVVGEISKLLGTLFW